MNTKNYRYEKKMIFDPHRIGQVRSWLFTHPDSFREAYPSRQVNNIYFDTLDYECMTDHRDGIGTRAKFRFRWYGPDWHIQRGQFELKRKTGHIGYKIVQEISTDLDISNLRWREIIRQLKKESNANFTLLLEQLTPVLINQYQREYYLSGDHKLRITLDYGMKAYSQRFGLYPNTNLPNPLLNKVVIEIKANRDQHYRIASALDGFPLRCLQNSKYMNAMNYIV